MKCAAGQIDINHASLSDLMSGFKVKLNKVVGQGIIDLRPWLQPQELDAVHGIDRGLLKQILASNQACATPDSTPPYSADACTTASTVDIQAATVDELIGRLSLSAATAQAIVAARPFGTLKLLNRDRFNGLPGIHAGFEAKLCLTPSPVRTDTQSFRWAYASQTTTVQRDKFQLQVPPNVLNATGGWASITPQITPTPDIPGTAWPSADFHISAPWGGGGKTVKVTLAKDPALAEFGPGYEPYIAHWDSPDRSSGEEIAGSDLMVNAADGTVTAAVTHLSFLDSLSRLIQWPVEILGNLLGGRFLAPSCNVAWNLETQSGDWFQNGARVHLTGANLNLPGNVVLPTGFPIKHCVESADGSTNATLRMLNNTRTMASLTAVAGTPDLGLVNIGGDALSFLMARVTEQLTHHPVAYPGGEVTATVPVGSAAAVRMKPSFWLTVLWAALDISPVHDFIDKVTTVPVLKTLVSVSANCALTAIGVAQIDSSTTPQGFGETLKSVLQDCIHAKVFWNAVAAALKAGVISSDLANGVASTLDKLSRYNLWVDIAKLGFTGADLLIAAAGGNAAATVSIQHFAAKPVFDAHGHTVQAQCLRANGFGWTLDQGCQDTLYFESSHPPTGSGGGTTGLPTGYILRAPNGAATFYNADAKTSQSISDGTTYLCLARHYAVDWAPNFSLYPGTIIVSPSASCTDQSDTRPIAPRKLPLNATILRQADGTAWVIYDGVHRFHISSGSEFQCWVSPPPGVIKFYVWDQVDASLVNQFSVDPAVTNISNCNNGF